MDARLRALFTIFAQPYPSNRFRHGSHFPRQPYPSNRFRHGCALTRAFHHFPRTPYPGNHFRHGCALTRAFHHFPRNPIPTTTSGMDAHLRASSHHFHATTSLYGTSGSTASPNDTYATWWHVVSCDILPRFTSFGGWYYYSRNCQRCQYKIIFLDGCYHKLVRFLCTFILKVSIQDWNITGNSY